jgi:hypothetical protein
MMKIKMNKSIILFNEPELEFRFSQKVKDPHDGLSLFGPFDADESSCPKSFPYIVIGTESGLSLFEAWSEAVNCPALLDAESLRAKKKVPNFRLWPPYPGFEAAFSAQWPTKPIWSHQIDSDELLTASRLYEKHERASNVVDLYLKGIEIAAAKLEPKPIIVICIVPEEIYKNCRPKSRISEPTGEVVSSKRVRDRKIGQTELPLFGDDMNLELYQYSSDFRRQLKARGMQYDIPIQIMRESTLRLSDEIILCQRQLTPLSDRMWNFTTALYYKSGGKPWRLVTAREGVCYIGISFRRTDEADEAKTACCAAQMFLNDGDGIVFLGDFGPWYSPKNNQFHLSKVAAKELLKGTLETYQQLEGKELTEIFLHSRSFINDEEFAGYQEACPANVKLVGIRVRTDRHNGVRLFRTGEMPVMRGTFLRLNDRSGLLWASGFKPRLATYDGWEIPVPLRIDIQYGDAPIERVAQDIFGLTKLNYNACRLGSSQPITVGFSDAVGEILVSNPTVTKRKHNFKYYI